MGLRRDRVVGGVLLALAAATFLAGRKLELGTLAAPGAMLLPAIAAALVAILAAAILVRAGASPQLSASGWSDAGHAASIVAVTAAAALLYERIGFVAAVVAMLFTLQAVVERVPVARAAVFSCCAAGLAWLLFARVLKSPLPVGPWGF